MIQLVLTPGLSGLYEINTYRRDQLCRYFTSVKQNISGYIPSDFCRLQRHLSSTLVDQLPVVERLIRFISELQFVLPTPPKASVILEMVPEIREALERETNTEKVKNRRTLPS